VNLDVPRSGDDYLHRSGRTGRAGRRGLTITLVGAPEWNRMAGVERYLGLSVEHVVLDGLQASFKGAPKRRKPSQPVAKKRTARKAEAPAKAKPKQRLRDRKNIGKRRQPSNKPGAAPEAGQGVEAGFEPPKRRS